MNIKKSRRKFLNNALVAGLGASFFSTACGTPGNKKSKPPETDFADLDSVINQQVLKRTLFPDALIIDRLELLYYEGNYLCRVTATNGAEGLSVSNNFQMESLYPIFTRRLKPFFIGKDARDLESLLDEVYVYRSNYKLQSLALWVPLATIEFAILDMLGRVAGKPMGELIGESHHPYISVYQANNFRGRSAEESIDLIEKQVRETDARALKFKVAGRMSSPDEPSGRSEKLIPMVRERFGEEMTIYADANGGYTPEEAIRIGKIMEEHRFDFFEEPVPFDWYEETWQVTEALNIPVAGGEQEPSMHNFRWLIGHDALDVVQPDVFYFGGMIRSIKVARMGEVRGKTCTPHISGSGLGYLYMMHFVSVLPNAGPYHEFKGFNDQIPLECPTSSLTSDQGKVKVPTGPGSGVIIDPEFIAKHRSVEG